jgi:flagellar basal-body rod protein FlgC
MIGSLDTTSSALVAQRMRLDTIAGNIANAQVTRQEDGSPGPYRRRVVNFATGQADGGGPGVHVDSITEDPSEFRLKYDPGHPDRIQSGPMKDWVQLPNVSITMEYIDAMEAGRAYEANAAMMNVTKDMLRQAVRLFA